MSWLKSLFNTVSKTFRFEFLETSNFCSKVATERDLTLCVCKTYFTYLTCTQRRFNVVQRRGIGSMLTREFFARWDMGQNIIRVINISSIQRTDNLW